MSSGVPRRIVLASALGLAACKPFQPHERTTPAGGGETAAGAETGGEVLWRVGESGRLTAFDPRTDDFTASVDLGLTLAKYQVPDLYSDGAALWAYLPETGAVVVVDAATARVTGRATVPPERPRQAVVPIAAYGALWIGRPAGLSRITPDGKVTPIAIPADFAPVAATATERWLWWAGDNGLTRIDPKTALARYEQATGSSDLVTVGDAVAVRSGRDLVFRDAETGAVLQTVAAPEGQLLASGPGLWVVGDSTVSWVEPGAPVKQVSLGDAYIDNGAVAAGSLWLAASDVGEVIRIDSVAKKMTARIPVDLADPEDPLFWLLAGKNTIWAVDGDFYNGACRVDPATNRARRVIPADGIESLSYAVGVSPASRG